MMFSTKRLPYLALSVLLALPALASPDGERVKVQVKPGDCSQSMVFVATGDDGDAHSLKIRSDAGKVMVEAEPDPERPWLGVLLDDSGSTGDEAGRTLKVLSVAKDSPASRAGLQPGDVVTGIDGTALADRGDKLLLGGHEPGDSVTLQVRRDGRSLDVPVRISGHPGRVEFDKAEGLEAFAFAGDSLMGLHGLEALESLKGLKGIPCMPGQKCPLSGFSFQIGGGPMLGVSIESMSDQLARFFGTEPGRGVLVKDVVESSAAAAAGIEAGDVILRVGTTDVRSAGDIQSALSGLEKGDTVDVEVLRRGVRKTLTATLDGARRTGMFQPGQFGADAETFARVAEQLAHERAQAGSELSAEALEKAQAALERAAEAMDKERFAVEREQERRLDRERRRSRDTDESDSSAPRERSPSEATKRTPTPPRIGVPGRSTHLAQ